MPPALGVASGMRAPWQSGEAAAPARQFMVNEPLTTFVGSRETGAG